MIRGGALAGWREDWGGIVDRGGAGKLSCGRGTFKNFIAKRRFAALKG